MNMESDGKIDKTSWMVLAGACLVFFTTTPYMSVFELLYEEILSKSEDKTEVGTWAFTIYLMMWNLISLVVGPLCNMRSHRWTCSIGVALMGAGAILSAFSDNKTDLYLSFGFLSGCGQGLVTNTAILILVAHFGEKQGLALGVSFMVMAIGGIAAPQIVNGLLIHCTHQVSIIIFGCIILSGLIGSSMFFPIKTKCNKDEEQQSLNDKDNQQSSKTETSNWKNNPIVKMFTLINWSLLKDGHFILTLLGSAYTFNALVSFYLFLPLYSSSIGITTKQKSVLLSIIASLDMVTRFLFAWMGDWNCTKKVFCQKPRRLLYAFGVIGVCAIMICLPWIKDFESLIAACVIYGIFAGSVPGNGPLVYSEDFREDLASAMGIASIGRGLAALSMGPLANLAKTKANGIAISLWVTGGLSMFWMVLWFLEVIFKSCKTTRQS